jgi:hypothetical protein
VSAANAAESTAQNCHDANKVAFMNQTSSSASNEVSVIRLPEGLTTSQ